jgi:Na+-transporting methylmalonyl-CoA/oxaloacetate decarboxylase gamma subunit
VTRTEEPEGTITVRRSTLIFAVLIVLVLLFIMYAIGKRVGKADAAPASRSLRKPETVQTVRGNLHETRRSALPPALRNKCAVFLKVVDHTQSAGAANARKCRDFLRQAPAARFIRAAEHDAFILAYNRKLFVCVGPFDGLETANIESMLPRLRTLRYNGLRQFRNASVAWLPHVARLFD